MRMQKDSSAIVSGNQSQMLMVKAAARFSGGALQTDGLPAGSVDRSAGVPLRLMPLDNQS